MVKKSIEEKYQKKTHHEHILEIPDTYIGSVEKDKTIMWVFNDDTEKMEKKEIEFVPGLYKIFDEILVNTRDQTVRSNKCKTIKVSINREEGLIEVWNDGDGIDVVIHKDHNIYIPELIFGHLLTSTNYDKNEQKTVGGKNGYGAKLCLKKGTLLPTFDGDIEKIENLKVGDKLIGDNGKERTILSKIEGNDRLFKIFQENGDSYVVNEEHILCLKMPDHKVIHWNNKKLSHEVSWFDTIEMEIKSTSIKVEPKVMCSECYTEIDTSLENHFIKNHINKSIKKLKSFTVQNMLNKHTALKRIKEIIKRVPDNNTFNISVKDYLKINMKNKLFGYNSECVEWTRKDVLLDPYILGLWLGKNYYNNHNILIKDDRILKYIYNLKTQFNIIHLTIGKIISVKHYLAEYNLLDVKNIPKEYIVNSKQVRLKVLAGLIDNDGIVTDNGFNIFIDKNIKNQKLVEDIQFLTRSLGLICTVNKFNSDYYNISILGNGIENIPTLLYTNKFSNKINYNKIVVEEVERGDFIGLQVDGNNKFVLKDFTVTHNCNIYSSMFKIETVDAKTKQKYTQVFTDNMYNIEKPKIKKLTDKTIKPYTKISFKPDFKRFGLTNLTDNMIALMYKRVYDIAACTNNTVKVYLNDKLLNIKGFDKYVDYFYQDNENNDNNDNNDDNNESESENNIIGFNLKKCKVFETVNDRWNVCVVFNPENGYEHISFVNGISTYKGGTHVDYVINNIIKDITYQVNKKNKSLKLKPSQIKDNLTVFVDSVIVNPSFGSQTKEELVSKKDSFGSTCELSKNFFTKLSKTGLIDELIEFGKLKEQSILKKTDGKKVNKISGIEKLEDANKAGTKQSTKCKLILTEGDSAKALAIAGLSVIGRDFYGIFPLKGKLLNVREANPKQMLNNDEITNLKKILGLRHDVVYDDVSKLRYGSIVIFTDQDVDGSHIKGLIINFIHYFWPSLTKLDEFITCLATPVLKIKKGKQVLDFYNLSAYDKWKEKELQGWSKPKYYKGLGTSTSTEAREYFQDFEKKLIKYYWSDDSKLENKINDNIDEDINENNDDKDSDDKDSDDNNSYDENDNNNDNDNNDEKIDDDKKDDEKNNKCYDAITLAFAKKRSNDRKLWLKKYSKDQFLDNNDKEISVSEFVHKELIHFSKDDNDRSLPSVVDGFKTSQRKIYYVSEIKNLHNQSKEIRVAQLAGAISEKANYHHGEASLCGAIVNMAQNYVGSNNINLLEPIGQFGTRLVGGKDSASTRYINTRFTSIAQKIFRLEDMPILDRVVDDGDQVEPEWYIPIIPMILVNGADGIGTGFSTKVPAFNPIDIMKNIYKKLDGDDMTSMKPWYRNFKGNIIKIAGGKYEIRGEYKQIDENTLEITELPIGVWTTQYKTFLESVTIGTNTDKKNQKKEFIEEFENHCSEVSIKFIIKFPEYKLKEYMDKGAIENKLKLVTTKSTSNMHLHCSNGLEIKRYNTPEAIIDDFYDLRIINYQKRKDYMLIKCQLELDIISWKRKFIKYVIKEKIVIFKQKKEIVYNKLEELGFPKMGKNPLKQFTDKEIIQNDIEEIKNNDEIKQDSVSYDYLLKINIEKFTQDELDKLDEEYKIKDNYIKQLKSLLPKDMWKIELDELMIAYKKWNKEQTGEFEKNSTIQVKKKKIIRKIILKK